MSIERQPKRFVPALARTAAAAVLLAGMLDLAPGAARRGAEDVHHEKGAGCLSCHSTDESTLRSQASRDTPMLADDLDGRCATCHDPLDASHKTGIPPKKPVPESLPLSASGTITCATCHFMHAENDTFGDFVRIDNRKGALCLTCHDLADLQ